MRAACHRSWPTSSSARLAFSHCPREHSKLVLCADPLNAASFRQCRHVCCIGIEHQPIQRLAPTFLAPLQHRRLSLVLKPPFNSELIPAPRLVDLLAAIVVSIYGWFSPDA
uniref:Uncharacterized protein n=1 Tax=Cryptomonas curvata TaxID=233186 RepID=A0A6T8CQG5_9CRYP